MSAPNTANAWMGLPWKGAVTLDASWQNVGANPALHEDLTAAVSLTELKCVARGASARRIALGRLAAFLSH